MILLFARYVVDLGYCIYNLLIVVKFCLIISAKRSLKLVAFANESDFYNVKGIDVNANRTITLSVDKGLLVFNEGNVLSRVQFFKDHNNIEAGRSY